MAKGKGKKKKGSDNGAVVDENKEENDERANLINTAFHLKKEIQKEEATLADFQRQLEKLKYFWNIEKEKFEEKKSQIIEKEWKLKELDRNHRNEISTYKQKLKHLLFEQRHEITRSKTRSEIVFKRNRESHRFSAESELKNDKKDLTERLKEEDASHEQFLRTLEVEYDEALTNLQNEFTRRAGELTAYSENVSKTKRQALERRRKSEIVEIETRKNEQIKDLIAEQEEEITEMRAYYNSQTTKNLTYLETLKSQLRTAKKLEKSVDKQKTQKRRAHATNIATPLEKAARTNSHLQNVVTNYRDERAVFRDVATALRETADELDERRWRYEVLYQRYADVDGERGRLRRERERFLVEERRRCDFRRLLLEKKGERLTDVGEQYTAALSDILTRANFFEPEAVMQVQSRLTNVVEVKNGQILELEGELDRVVAARRHMVARVKSLMEEYEIPLEEMGWSVLRGDSPSKIIKP